MTRRAGGGAGREHCTQRVHIQPKPVVFKAGGRHGALREPLKIVEKIRKKMLINKYIIELNDI